MQDQIKMAMWLNKTLGAKTAAGYLRNRNWSIEAALYIITGS